MGRFTPVCDPEKSRAEQDEESLRKHRQFDTPFSLLAKNLNDKARPGQDTQPLGRPSGELELDEGGLWRKKAALFDKKKTWGRETTEYSNPEQARSEGNSGPKWGRPGVVGWGIQGSFGSKAEDKGLAVMQRGEVNQTMVKNEKGLWVRKKAVDGDDLPPAAEGKWRCSECGLEQKKELEFCGRFECSGRRPACMAGAKMHKASSSHEDPRMEAAKLKGRGTATAQSEALKALEERRRCEMQAKESVGMMRRTADSDRSGKVTTVNSSSQQVKPAPRVRQCHKWQGVQRSDKEAARVVAKAIGGDADRKLHRIDGGEMGSKVPSSSKKTEDFDLRIAVSVSRSRSRSRSPRTRRSPSRSPKHESGEGKEVVVDFF